MLHGILSLKLSLFLCSFWALPFNLNQTIPDSVRVILDTRLRICCTEALLVSRPCLSWQWHNFHFRGSYVKTIKANAGAYSTDGMQGGNETVL